MLASSGAMNIRQSVDTRPPMNDANDAIPMAFPAFPFCASGYPSRTVAAADGVPGVLSNTADMDPPYIDPQKRPQSMTSATSLGSIYTRGRSRMMPIDPESPGIAPMIIPIIMPKTIRTNVVGWKTAAKPESIYSNIGTFHQNRVNLGRNTRNTSVKRR